ncbi:MAG: DUF1697 domain-containing protein [Caulobacteraceae bacterium]|nr:DUF1697 domain-containing protein [Caulobacteraceae bacterium]
MTTYIALLRAVNVGGTGKLAMADLRDICRELGFEGVRTYITSGNAIFRSALAEHQVKAALEARLADHASRPVGVIVRSRAELADVVARNPFKDRAANRTVALFVDEPLPADALDHLVGWNGEDLELGKREIYIHYGEGMAGSRLRVPAARHGTARNLNTVAKLADMAGG